MQDVNMAAQSLPRGVSEEGERVLSRIEVYFNLSPIGVEILSFQPSQAGSSTGGFSIN